MIPQVWYPWWCWCHRPWSLRNRLGKNLMSLLGMKSYTTLTWHRPWKGTIVQGLCHVQVEEFWLLSLGWSRAVFHRKRGFHRVDSFPPFFLKTYQTRRMGEPSWSFFLAQGSQIHLLGFFSSQLVAGMSDEKRTVHEWINKALPLPVPFLEVKFVQRFF